MKLIELHILQSFPVSCLNRDDLGAPKTAIFGGATRARISSQCLKRAIRLLAKELCPELYKGERSKLIVEPIAQAVEAHGLSRDKALEASKAFCDEMATLDEKALKERGVLQVKTLMFLSPAERAAIAQELASIVNESKGAKETAKKIKSAAAKAKEAKLIDAADIALFGRMVASDHSLTVEGAAMFSHALSTHRADNDIDFFTAVDDLQPDDEAGSAMMAPLEFTSAVYYRYAGLNLDLLKDEKHLHALSPEDLKRVVDSFIRATLTAVPGARRNSMNANTLPGFVLGLVRDKGQPLQLVNAFEEPVRAARGLMAASKEKLKAHHEELRRIWGIETAVEVTMPEVSLEDFCKKLVSRV